MYPPFKQFETRRREAEEWIALREARRVAKANTKTVGAGPPRFEPLAGRRGSALGRTLRSIRKGGQPEPGLRPAPQLPSGLEHNSLGDTITIRPSRPEDRDAILRLRTLDGRKPPADDLLLAFAGEELRAALPLDGGDPIADPFHRTAELVDLLCLRAAGWSDRIPLRHRTLLVRPAYGER
jgi:hypothetical protein